MTAALNSLRTASCMTEPWTAPLISPTDGGLEGAAASGCVDFPVDSGGLEGAGDCGGHEGLTASGLTASGLAAYLKFLHKES